MCTQWRVRLCFYFGSSFVSRCLERRGSRKVERHNSFDICDDCSAAWQPLRGLRRAPGPLTAQISVRVRLGMTRAKAHMLTSVFAQGRTSAVWDWRNSHLRLQLQLLNTLTGMELCLLLKWVIIKMVLIHHREIKAHSDLELLTVAAETPLQGRCGAAFKSHPCPLHSSADERVSKRLISFQALRICMQSVSGWSLSLFTWRNLLPEFLCESQLSDLCFHGSWVWFSDPILEPDEATHCV